MKNLITLVKMQLKEKLNLKNLEYEKISVFNTAVSILAAILKFAAVTAVFAGILFLVNYIGLFSLVKRVPASVMSIAFWIMLIASCISCTLGLTKAMYFSRDNAILLTLPCKPIQVYLSKLIIFFAYELKRNFSFMVPLFIAYFILNGYPFGAYIWLLVCFLFVSLFTVAVGAILSIPAMFISNIFRQHKAIQIGTLISLVSVLVIGLFYVVSLIPENLDLRATWPLTTTMIRNMLQEYTVKFKLIYDLTLVFLGEEFNVVYVIFPLGRTLLRFLVWMGCSAVLIALGLVIALPLFYKMASTPFEYLKKAVKPKKNRVTSAKLTTFFTEFISSIKDSGRLFSNVGIMISIPFLIFLLNKIFYAMNTSSTGEYLVLLFNVLMILLVALNSNANAASIYSRDGRAAYLIKTQPTKPGLLLFSKLMPDAMFCIVSLIGTFAILSISSKMGVLNALFLMLGIIFVYFAHLIYCAELDIMNPQHEIYATVGASDNNPNETKATVSAFIISFLVAAITVYLVMDGTAAIREIVISDTLYISTAYIKIACVALAYAVYRVYLFFSNIKLYYKEK